MRLETIYVLIDIANYSFMDVCLLNSYVCSLNYYYYFKALVLFFDLNKFLDYTITWSKVKSYKDSEGETGLINSLRRCFKNVVRQMSQFQLTEGHHLKTWHVLIFFNGTSLYLTEF